MKKAVVVVSILVLGAAGYLLYDWHTKTKMQAAEPSITFYTWTDESGAKHFTDTTPPKGALNIQTSKGYQYIAPPLVVTIREKTVHYYERIRNKLFPPKQNKKGKARRK